MKAQSLGTGRFPCWSRQCSSVMLILLWIDILFLPKRTLVSHSQYFFHLFHAFVFFSWYFPKYIKITFIISSVTIDSWVMTLITKIYRGVTLTVSSARMHSRDSPPQLVFWFHEWSSFMCTPSNLLGFNVLRCKTFSKRTLFCDFRIWMGSN